MLDVTRLRVLVAVARNGSVTAAARALNYAQPSVSHHIARLEAETGTQLLERVGRGIRLTEAGRLLAERAEEIIGRLDAAEAELAAHVGLREGPGPAGGIPVGARHPGAGRGGTAGRRDPRHRVHADRGRAAGGTADAAGRLRRRCRGLPALPGRSRPSAAGACGRGHQGRAAAGRAGPPGRCRRTQGTTRRQSPTSPPTPPAAGSPAASAAAATSSGSASRPASPRGSRSPPTTTSRCRRSWRPASA